MRVTLKQTGNAFTLRKRQRIELRRKLRSYVEPEALREYGAPDWLVQEYSQVHPGLPSLAQVHGWLDRLFGGEAEPLRRRRTQEA